MIVGTTRMSGMQTSTAVQSGASPRRLRSRACSIGLIALALAVFLWGFGYKLSLYCPHENPAFKASVAKLWNEHRSIASASKLSVKSHVVPDSQAIITPTLSFSTIQNAAVSLLFEGDRAIAFWAFLVPFRSPPASRFCIA
jgi:hypothetical protein